MEHFLDEMDVNECVWILRNLGYVDRNLWETTRMKIFATSSMFSKGQLQLTDIMKFPWDKAEETVVTEDTTPAMTDDERKRMEAYFTGVLNAGETNKPQ